MKTIAVRLEEEMSAQLAVLAQLEDSSVAELIREGAELIIERKRAQADLADKASGAIAEIEEEAAERKSAIEALFGSTGEQAAAPKQRRSRQQKSDAD